MSLGQKEGGPRQRGWRTNSERELVDCGQRSRNWRSSDPKRRSQTFQSLKLPLPQMRQLGPRRDRWHWAGA